MNRTCRRVARAFTLIELLIVIGIIGLLIGITLLVGTQVMHGGKSRVTMDAIRVLDTGLQQYIAATDGNPPPYVDHPGGGPSGQPLPILPVADARDMENMETPTDGRMVGYRMINSVGLFYRQAASVPAAKGTLEALPGKLAQQRDELLTLHESQPAKGTPPLMTVLDGWGNPIRYVHPAFQGVITGDITAGGTPSPSQPRDITQIVGAAPAQHAWSFTKIRRNNVLQADPVTSTDQLPDSDGGLCPGGRPYFYSAGADGRVGFKKLGGASEDYNKDNVYAVKPEVPQQ